MPLVEWRPEFAIGLPEVDHEHRELIELINQAHAGLGEGAGAEAVSEVLGEIHARIAAHFALEERIMREAHYDGFDAHKDDHEHLLDEIRDIMDAYEDRAEFDQAAFGARLGAWFTEHFRSEDARLHKFLR
jgi:hemerythrin-like metal-binding protein